MKAQRLGVGMVGLQPGRSWGAIGHVPALAALADRFDLVGVANSHRASAQRAIDQLGLTAQAYDDVAQLVAAPDVDVVTVAVRVPAHLDIVRMAIEHGKHVYCEWPLGNGLREAERMADWVRERGLVGVTGTQAILAPEVQHARALVAQGELGQVLSTTLTGWGGMLEGSGSIPDAKTYAYLLDRSNGANVLTIPVGHSLAALTHVLGPLAQVSALMATRRPSARALDSGMELPVTSPDQVLVAGTLASGVPLSLHYRGGLPHLGEGLCWDIHGTEGDLRVTGPSGHMQMVPLTLRGARAGQEAGRVLDIPASLRAGWPEASEPGNVARLYAAMYRDIVEGTRTAPSFDDAVRLHRVLDAIERADADGMRRQP